MRPLEGGPGPVRPGKGFKTHPVFHTRPMLGPVAAFFEMPPLSAGNRKPATDRALPWRKRVVHRWLEMMIRGRLWNQCGRWSVGEWAVRGCLEVGLSVRGNGCVGLIESRRPSNLDWSISLLPGCTPKSYSWYVLGWKV